MFFFSLSPLRLNIAHPDMSLWMIFSENFLFLQNSNERAYLPELRHMKACKSEYVKDCTTWLDSYQGSQKSNSRNNKWKITILK